VEILSKQSENFALQFNKVKRRNKTKQVNIEEVSQHLQLLSQLESYSILEKINEWKKEEGILD